MTPIVESRESIGRFYGGMWEIVEGQNVSETKHVHQLGTGNKCTIEGCDFTLKVARFIFSISVHDNETGKEIVDEVFGCSSVTSIQEALDEAKEKLRDLP